MGSRELAEEIVRTVLLDAGCDFMAEDSVKFVAAKIADKDATIARLEAENAGLRAECLAWRERAGKRGYLTGQWITDGKILVGGGKRMPEADATDAAGWLKPKEAP